MDFFKTIINEFTKMEEVIAIGIGGSSAALTDDTTSDIDVYVFVSSNISLEKRNKIIKPISSCYEIGCEYFGAGDEFFVDELNKQLDIMYFDKTWFEDVVNNTWVKYYPQNGYTTCFLYTLNILNVIYDKNNWLKNLKEKINTPYPQELKESIIKRNLMLLKDKPFASYYEQIEKAIKRNDLNSVNHRISAFLASYFDIIFAKNEILHSGEKRLVKFALNNCKILPKDFEKDVNSLAMSDISLKLNIASRMVENLKTILWVYNIRGVLWVKKKKC